MKNGDKRSSAWIQRALQDWTRDNEVTQTRLMLISIAPIPSLDEIQTWTDSQCLLSDDWAFAEHLRASDNLNRVPAVPEHLVPYQRHYPQRTPKQAARDLVKAMSDDNSACFKPTAKQWAALAVGVERMQKAGCHFTEAEVDLFAAGEHTDMLEHFNGFDGFEPAQKVLNWIFEGRDDSGRVKAA